MLRNLLFISLIVIISGTYKGRYTTRDGQVIQYYLENTALYSQLILSYPDNPVPLVNTTHTKSDGVIDFNILGEHFRSDDENVEEEMEITTELMESAFGRSVVELSWYVYEEHGVYGYQDDSMMLLYQLAIFAHSYHDMYNKNPPPSRRRRSLGFSNSVETAERSEMNPNLPVEAKSACNSSNVVDHGGCDPELAVIGTDIECRASDSDTPDVHQFTPAEIESGCYGLCGPWCHCWTKICGDCCSHPGCYQHDVYCTNPKSFACKTGKGVVYGRGLHTCK